MPVKLHYIAPPLNYVSALRVKSPKTIPIVTKAEDEQLDIMPVLNTSFNPPCPTIFELCRVLTVVRTRVRMKIIKINSEVVKTDNSVKI